MNSPEFRSPDYQSPFITPETVKSKEENERLELKKSLSDILNDTKNKIQKESPEKLPIYEAFESLIKSFEAKLYKRHGNKNYHHPRHSINLAIKGVEDLKGLGDDITPEDILIYIAEAISHDIVIKELTSDNQEVTDESVANMPLLATIKRNRGFYDTDQPGGIHGNEAESAKELIVEMKKNPVLAKLLSEQPKLEERIADDISATFPGIIWSGEPYKSKPAGFNQPYNTEKTSITGFVLGQNDLRMAYREKDSTQILSDGDAEWVELHRPITYRINKALAETGEMEKVPEIVFKAFEEPERKDIVANIIDWVKDQTQFVKIQQEEFKNHCDKNKSLNDMGMKEVYKAKFEGFTNALDITKTKAEELSQEYSPDKPLTVESFYKLLKNIGAVA